MFKFGKKAIVVATAAVVLGGATAAYAYWNIGSGSTSGQVDDTSPILQANFDMAGLTPGNQTPVTFSETNTGTTGTVIHSLTTTVDVSPDTGKTCPAGSFTMDGPYWINFQVNPDDSNVLITDEWSGEPVTGWLNFVNLPTQNQDGCKGATVTISVDAS